MSLGVQDESKCQWCGNQQRVLINRKGEILSIATGIKKK